MAIEIVDLTMKNGESVHRYEYVYLFQKVNPRKSQDLSHTTTIFNPNQPYHFPMIFLWYSYPPPGAPAVVRLKPPTPEAPGPAGFHSTGDSRFLWQFKTRKRSGKIKTLNSLT